MDWSLPECRWKSDTSAAARYEDILTEVSMFHEHPRRSQVHQDIYFKQKQLAYKMFVKLFKRQVLYIDIVLKIGI